MNKASGGDGIPVELFQILKDDAVKVLHSIGQQIWETQQWPQDWKRSIFIPIPKKGSQRMLRLLSVGQAQNLRSNPRRLFWSLLTFNPSANAIDSPFQI